LAYSSILSSSTYAVSFRNPVYSYVPHFPASSCAQAFIDYAASYR
jgi:hypothetical protein